MSFKKETGASAPVMDLVHGPVGKTLLLFSFPFMLSTLLQTLYSTVDTIIVGQFLGSAGLSAVANGTQLMQMAYMLCIGFSNAGQVLIAQAKGAEQYGRMQSIIGTLFALETGLSFLVGTICLVFVNPILQLLKTPPEAMVQARYYIVICSIGIIFTGLYTMFSAVLRGMGDSKHPLLFVVIATGINVVLDLLFVAVFHWNVAGAALATILGQAVSVVCSFLYLAFNSGRYGISFSLRKLQVKKEIGRRIFGIGLPMALSGAAIQVSFLFVSGMVNRMGVDTSAAFGVTQKIRSIPGFMAQGFGQGATSMIGQNLGADRKDRAGQTVRWCTVFCACVYGLFGILYLTVPQLLYRMYTQDPAVLSFARMTLTILVLEIPASCFMQGSQALINAQGFVKLSLAVAVLDAIAGKIFLCWLCGYALHLGSCGLFLGNALGTYVTSVIVFGYYISGIWKKREKLV